MKLTPVSEIKARHDGLVKLGVQRSGVEDALDHASQDRYALLSTLKELLELVETDASFENRDIKPYKYDAIVDDIKSRASTAIKASET